MRKLRIALIAVFLCFAFACSPREYLTRRLAADLIAGSDGFKTVQNFWLHTGVISNKEYLSPQYLVLQRHGWITGAGAPCASNVAPPPCWEIALTPLGVETLRDLMPAKTTASQYFSFPVARRELIAVTGISKSGDAAEVDFQWRWTALNEVGAALYSGGMQYNSTVSFRHYDDGWRMIEGSSFKSNQGLDDALKNAEPAR